MSSPAVVIPSALVLLASALAAHARGPDERARPARRSVIDTVTRRYDVRLAMTGYTGLAKSQDCDAIASPAGFDSLIGTVTGIENASEPDEDVVYTGTLRRSTRIDYCLAPGIDVRKWCVATLTGAVSMQVEITVYGESGNGAWLKAQPAGPPDTLRVAGTCPQSELADIRADYPSGESGGSPDGQPIGETATATFRLNGVRRLRVAYFPPDAVQGGWGLRVTRVVP